MGNSRGHSLTLVSGCGNQLNQAWEICTTIGQSGDWITHAKWYDFLYELISPYGTIMTPSGNGAILSFILIG